MKVVLCWPHSVDGVDLDRVVPKFYIHGIFSKDRAVWLSKSNYANDEFRTKAEYRHGRLWEVDGVCLINIFLIFLFLDIYVLT